MEPASSAVLSGASRPPRHPGIGAGFVRLLFRRELVDELAVVTDDEAFATAQRLAREEAILAGISSGASVAVALRLCARPEMAGKLVVTMICDSAERYVSTPRIKAAAGGRP